MDLRSSPPSSQEHKRSSTPSTRTRSSRASPGSSKRLKNTPGSTGSKRGRRTARLKLGSIVAAIHHTSYRPPGTSNSTISTSLGILSTWGWRCHRYSVRLLSWLCTLRVPGFHRIVVVSGSPSTAFVLSRHRAPTELLQSQTCQRIGYLIKWRRF